MRGRRQEGPVSSLWIGLALVFFVFTVASNHFSDFNLLAFTAGSASAISSSTSSLATPKCVNTQQGKYYITDDRGYTCRWQDLQGNGCCNPDKVEQFSCSYCNSTAECCMEYEYCISCCMHPDNELSIKSVMMVQDNPALQSSTNNFDFCKARCRTSSESIFYDKQYKSFHKYCYGTQAPSREADIGVDRGHYETKVHQQVKHDSMAKLILDQHFDTLPVHHENQLDFGADIFHINSSSGESRLLPVLTMWVPFIGTLLFLILGHYQVKEHNE